MNAITERPSGGRLSVGMKLAALIAVLACLALGLIGLVVPLIPGIVFLALAAAIAARHSRWAASRLRRHRGIGRWLDRADGFLDAGIATKAKLAVLYGAKAVVDAIVFTTTAARRIRGLLRRRF